MKYKKLAALAAGCSLAMATLLIGENQSYAVEELPPELNLNVSSRYDSGVKNEDGGATEIVAYNADNYKYYVINGTTKQIEIVPLPKSSSYSAVKVEKTVNLEKGLKEIKPNFSYGDVTSISINTDSDLIAAAVQAGDYNDNGLAVFLDYNGNILHIVEAGKQPDMITFTPDGKKVLVANEGEPREGYEKAVDPEGSVSIIELPTDITKATVKDINFEALDSQREELVAKGIVLKKKTNPSVDFEPEYIAVNKKGNTAYVTLQEANAIATLDLTSGEWKNVQSLGFKDHRKKENALDFMKDKKIEIIPENLYGIYMPDGISSYEVNGKTYLVTANEGDSRDWKGYVNELEMELRGNEVVLFDTSDYDGLQPEKMYSFGGRSFSIYEAESMTQVFDSGSDFEKIIAHSLPDYFNASNNNTKLDNRSGKKGPEPEDVKIGQIGDRMYAFIGIERVGGIMMYDITNPNSPSFVQYINKRDFGEDIKGDVSPEGIAFIPASASTTGLPTLLAAHEVSGTVTAFTFGSPYKSLFLDIQGHWAQTAIEELANKHLLNGVAKDQFNPNAPMTRAQFITVLSRAQKINSTSKAPFSDVKTGDYFEDAIGWAYEKKLINSSNEMFNPHKPITREDAAVILYHFIKLTEIDLPNHHTQQLFKDDAAISPPAKEAIYILQQAGIFTGNKQQLFQPQSTLSRADATSVLYKLFTLK
ncbi:choice-of-anchor I family protein [Lysinibacillus sp. RSDA_15]|uniref:choice-of-anchor I family protein n=1 Tax=Lysinibacillus TaxID=400634 RepID=UPI0006915E31|nr:choice-of-anchor I family protein [Lysinibacillus sphaericus]